MAIRNELPVFVGTYNGCTPVPAQVVSNRCGPEAESSGNPGRLRTSSSTPATPHVVMPITLLRKTIAAPCTPSVSIETGIPPMIVYVMVISDVTTTGVTGIPAWLMLERTPEKVPSSASHWHCVFGYRTVPYESEELHQGCDGVSILDSVVANLQADRSSVVMQTSM
eukprot:7388082-Prymnesium_polylepis.1